MAVANWCPLEQRQAKPVSTCVPSGSPTGTHVRLCAAAPQSGPTGGLDADLDAVGHELGLGWLDHQLSGLDLERSSARANGGQAKRLTLLTAADADGRDAGAFGEFVLQERPSDAPVAESRRH